MNKVLCLLVVMAAIAQIYSAPADSGADTAVKGAEGEASQASAKVGKTAESAGDPFAYSGAAGGLMKAPMGMLTPIITFGKDMANDGEKLFKGFLGDFSPAGPSGKN